MEKVRVGIVGCGRILPMHATPATLLKQAELVAVCDIKKERADAAAQKYGVKSYTDYTEMFEEESLDVVHLCVPHYLHPVIAKAAFERNINVLSEKPMTITYESAQECVRLAKAKGVLYGVIFQIRYGTAPRFVKSALKEGKLGKIISARSTLTWNRSDEYYTSSDWKGTWDKEGGGVIIDQAIHSIDLVNWLIDSEIEHVGASLHNRGHHKVDVEDTAEGLITYRNGTQYAFYCMNNYGCDEPIEIRLFCEKGKVTLNYDEATIEYSDGKIEHAKQEDAGVAYEGAKDYWGTQHIREIEQFYNAVLGRGTFEITGEEALKTQYLISEIYKSGVSRN